MWVSYQGRQILGAVALGLSTLPAWPAVNVMLTEVPDYTWDAGCFGTATGNLMGYWDRHGFSDFYTGPTAGGVAPLSSDSGNIGIRSMWASRAGLDGRPQNQPGHMDNYWSAYESTEPDPYLSAGRPEHAPDCIGDFTGLNQNKWSDLNGECDGNIDGFSFVFWDQSGLKRENFRPEGPNGESIPDIPSGLRAWAKYRGGESDVFSQLVDFNPAVTSGQGFTFEDLRKEIDAGYPVLLFLQEYDQLARPLPGMPRGNPNIHGMLAYGYYVPDSGEQYVRYKTSWGSSGENTLSEWDAGRWQAGLPLRGVIGFQPRPRITSLSRQSGALILEWEGPASVMMNVSTRETTELHYYVVEKSTSASPTSFEPVTEPSTGRTAVLRDCCPEEAAFFRITLLPAPSP